MPIVNTFVEKDRDRGGGRRAVRLVYVDHVGGRWVEEVSTTDPNYDPLTEAQARVSGIEEQLRKHEIETAYEAAIAGTNPAAMTLNHVTRARVWQVLTRRLHNGPKNNLDLTSMKGLAQWIVNRATPAIRDDLNSVRTAGEVNALKVQWQALLDADITEYDGVGSEDDAPGTGL